MYHCDESAKTTTIIRYHRNHAADCKQIEHQCIAVYGGHLWLDGPDLLIIKPQVTAAIVSSAR